MKAECAERKLKQQQAKGLRRVKEESQIVRSDDSDESYHSKVSVDKLNQFTVSDESEESVEEEVKLFEQEEE